MKRFQAAGAVVLALCMAWSARAADTVNVAVKSMAIDVERPALGTGSRGSTVAGTGYYPIRDPQTKKVPFVVEQATVDMVILDNGIVEAWVCPALGGRLLRAIDKRTGVDYFWRRMREGKWVFDDHLPWNPGGVKASFPFFEHGLSLRVPAGYRVVTSADGATVVAMDMRFTNFTGIGDVDRYGHFGDETLTTMVTLRPGSSVVEWTQRKDNNNATPRSDRLWSDCSFPVPAVRKTVTTRDAKGADVTREVPDVEAMDQLVEFIYPARWVVNHGPSQVHTSPHWSAPRNWDVSHFAIDAPFGFVGGYYARENLNRLRINDVRPGHGPGAKLWTAPGSELFELWGGESWVFEYPGELRPAYQPTSFTHRFWIAQGIGKVSHANATAAVGVEGTSFKLVTSREGQAVVTDDTGKQVAAGKVGPHTVLAGTFSGKRLAVKLDGAMVMDQAFPLDRPVSAKETPVEPAAQAMFERLKAGVDPSHPTFFERGTYGRNQGQPGLVNGYDALVKVNDAGAPERTASLARVAYRLGDLDQAQRLAALAGGPAGDYVLGLVAMERGQATDFGKAGPEADYLRALLARKAGDTAKAATLARSYVALVPEAWYPRLALARWSQDTTAAAALAAENPASPEAQLVLKLLGQPHELDATLAGRAEAKKHLAIFEAQIERGEYQPLPRYPLEQVRKRGW